MMNAPDKKLASPLAEAKFMTDDEYYPSLLPKNIRPAIWRLRDLQPRLDALLKDPLKRADRRFLSLVNGDTPEENPGVLPGLFCGIQGINPGEHILPHRHNSFALYHIMKGKGYSVVEGERIDWEAGDILCIPVMAWHSNCNLDPKEPALFLATINRPLMEALDLFEIEDKEKIDYDYEVGKTIAFNK